MDGIQRAADTVSFPLKIPQIENGKCAVGRFINDFFHITLQNVFRKSAGSLILLHFSGMEKIIVFWGESLCHKIKKEGQSFCKKKVCPVMDQ